MPDDCRTREVSAVPRTSSPEHVRFGEGLVRGEDDRALFVAFRDDLEDEVGLRASEGLVADLIEDEDVGPQVVVHLAGQAAGVVGGFEVADHVVEGGEVDRVASPAGRDRQAHGDMRLPDPWRAQQRRVGFVLDEGQGGEVFDLTGVEVGLEGKARTRSRLPSPGRSAGQAPTAPAAPCPTAPSAPPHHSPSRRFRRWCADWEGSQQDSQPYLTIRPDERRNQFGGYLVVYVRRRARKMLSLLAERSMRTPLSSSTSSSRSTSIARISIHVPSSTSTSTPGRGHGVCSKANWKTARTPDNGIVAAVPEPVRSLSSTPIALPIVKSAGMCRTASLPGSSRVRTSWAILL